ncbi:hypothetical protein ACFL56_02370, partial [Candidatus Margulisiibacteriota bacterium]
MSIADRDKKVAMLQTAEKFVNLGFTIYSTKGTAEYLKKNNIKAKEIAKINEGHPHIVDLIQKNEINLIINTPSGKEAHIDDSYIRLNALKHKILTITTIPAA